MTDRADSPSKGTPMIRGRWACRVYPHPTKINSSVFCARTGSIILNVVLHNSQIETFDPEAYNQRSKP